MARVWALADVGCRTGPPPSCASTGERAMTGASLLTAAGMTRVLVLRGGPGYWAKAAGEPLEHG